MGQRCDTVGGEADGDRLGGQQRGILQGQGVVGFGQDADKISFGQRAQFDADRQAALQFGQQVGRFGDVERARGDEQYVVGFHRAVFGRDGGALDQRQQIALHAFARHIGPTGIGAGADLVDLVYEHDAAFLHRFQRGAVDGFIVQQLVGLFADQHVVAFGDGHLAADLAPAKRLAEDVGKIQGAGLLAGNIQHLHRVRGVGDLQFDHGGVQFAALQLAAKHLAGLLAGRVPGQRRQHAFLGGGVGAGFHILAHRGAGHRDGAIHQIADDTVDIAPDIANFGEFGRLDLEKRGFGQLGEAAGDFGFADPGGADHQDVFRIDLVAQVIGQTAAPPAVAQGHGDGAFRLGLANDVAVKFRDNLARGQVGHAGIP